MRWPNFEGLHLKSQRKGDLPWWTGFGWARVPRGTAGQVLTMNASFEPTWAIAGVGGLDYAEDADIQAVGTSSSAGVSTEVAPADHVHAHEAAHINHDTTWAAKGNLIVATANDTAQVLTVGSDGQLLTADAAAATGVKWADAPSSGISTLRVYIPFGSEANEGQAYTP